MEVILRQHVDKLGNRGEVVKVADGYARNFLLPRKLALPVTEGNKRHVERERKLILPEAIKAIGEFDVPLKLHRDVTVPLVIHVVKEGATE